MENKPSYYSVTPASVRYHPNLTLLAIALYGEITCLANKEGYCWASNSYFAKLYNKTTRTISQAINQLIKEGFLSSTIENKNLRKIYIKDFVGGLEENFLPLGEKLPDGVGKKLPHNITSKNNKNNKKPEIKISGEEKSDFIDTLIRTFEDNYRIKRNIIYKTLKGKDRKAMAGILSFYKKLKPDSNSETTLYDLDLFFAHVLGHDFGRTFLNEVTISKLNSNFNEYYQAIKAGNTNGHSVSGGKKGFDGTANASWAANPSSLNIYRKTN